MAVPRPITARSRIGKLGASRSARAMHHSHPNAPSSKPDGTFLTGLTTVVRPNGSPQLNQQVSDLIARRRIRRRHLIFASGRGTDTLQCADRVVVEIEQQFDVARREESRARDL